MEEFEVYASYNQPDGSTFQEFVGHIEIDKTLGMPNELEIDGYVYTIQK